MKPLTREDVVSDAWTGRQRERVLALLDERDAALAEVSLTAAERQAVRRLIEACCKLEETITYDPDMSGRLKNVRISPTRGPKALADFKIALSEMPAVPDAWPDEQQAVRRAVLEEAATHFETSLPAAPSWVVSRIRALAGKPEPECAWCGKPLARGPIGGGHFDWLECRCTR